MESHRGMLLEDENDEESEGDIGRKKKKERRKEKKNILNLLHGRQFGKLPEQLDWRDYGQYYEGLITLSSV